jgi:DegV family protein with EDD domain
MPSTAIVTDSTSDVPPEEAKALSIEVVPVLITLEGRSYVDGLELSRTDFYRRLPMTKAPATTAAPSLRTFEAVYEKVLSQGAERVLSIHLSEKLSSLINIARQAATSFGDSVQVFDSWQVSLAAGFQVMQAAAAALAGETFETILEVAQKARDHARVVAMIDTLEYIRRSGRVSWLRAGLGDLLRVKLLVRVADGVVQRIGEARTKARALEQLRSIAEGWGPLERLAILHSGVPAEAAEFAQRLRDLCGQSPLIVDVTTAIGTHVGPGSIGLAALSR